MQGTLHFIIMLLSRPDGVENKWVLKDNYSFFFFFQFCFGVNSSFFFPYYSECFYSTVKAVIQRSPFISRSPNNFPKFSVALYFLQKKNVNVIYLPTKVYLYIVVTLYITVTLSLPKRDRYTQIWLGWLHSVQGFIFNSSWSSAL